MWENIQKATECMEQDVSYLKDKLGYLTSKIGSFDSKNGIAALENIQQTLPTNLTSQRRQLDEYYRREVRRVWHSFAPEHLLQLQSVQGSLRLLLPHKTGVQGLGRNSRI